MQHLHICRISKRSMQSPGVTSTDMGTLKCMGKQSCPQRGPQRLTPVLTRSSVWRKNRSRMTANLTGLSGTHQGGSGHPEPCWTFWVHDGQWLDTTDSLHHRCEATQMYSESITTYSIQQALLPKAAYILRTQGQTVLERLRLKGLPPGSSGYITLLTLGFESMIF